MKTLFRRLIMTGAVLFAGLQATMAYSSTFLAMTFEEVVAQADLIVIGQVVSTESFWDPDHRIILEAPWAAEIRQSKDGIDHRYQAVWHLECRYPAGDLEFELKTLLIITSGK